MTIEFDPGTSEREEKRETFLQDGIRAWNEYKATGLHVTMEEADTWLANLGEGQDMDPPACHENWFVSLIGAGNARHGHSSETVDRDLYAGKLP